MCQWNGRLMRASTDSCAILPALLGPGAQGPTSIMQQSVHNDVSRDRLQLRCEASRLAGGLHRQNVSNARWCTKGVATAPLLPMAIQNLTAGHKAHLALHVPLNNSCPDCSGACPSSFTGIQKSTARLDFCSILPPSVQAIYSGAQSIVTPTTTLLVPSNARRVLSPTLAYPPPKPHGAIDYNGLRRPLRDRAQQGQ